MKATLFFLFSVVFFVSAALHATPKTLPGLGQTNKQIHKRVDACVDALIFILKNKPHVKALHLHSFYDKTGRLNVYINVTPRISPKVRPKPVPKHERACYEGQEL